MPGDHQNLPAARAISPLACQKISESKPSALPPPAGAQMGSQPYTPEIAQIHPRFSYISTSRLTLIPWPTSQTNYRKQAGELALRSLIVEGMDQPSCKIARSSSAA